MGRISISFILLVLILGFFIGTVSGSLIEAIFGLKVLNHALFADSVKIAADFYMIRNLELRLTPAGLTGLVLAAWFLYKR